MTAQTEHTEPNFRRVVTGHDASGKPVIWIDGNASNHKFPSDNISSTLMWSTDASPTQMLSNEDEVPAPSAQHRPQMAAALP